MSAGGAFGGARGYQPRPPEKGVFPLDHFGECKALKQAYLDCLRENASRADACGALSKQYLECRMDRNLMARQDLRDLGFRDSVENQGSGQNGTSVPQTQEPDWKKRKEQGFVAGLRR